MEAHLGDATIKQRFVTPMFDLVAPRYDDFTRRFSFGMDAGWKRELVHDASAVIPSDGRCLDVACGTGDLAFAVARARRDVRVTAIDASLRMLAAASQRPERRLLPNVEFAAGDLAALSLPAASADAVTAGYAMRNAPSWERALAELARVLRPGGHLLTLDFYRPRSAAWRALFLSYLGAAGNLYGWLWHREPVAYGYIARSIEHFVSWQEFSRGLEAGGLRVTAVRPRLGGAIALHHAVKT